MNARDLVLSNARVVLADRVIEAGWVAVADGLIVEIGEGRAPGVSQDMAGDLLLPGLVELHTDHLEAHFTPRPKVRWNPVAAVVSYDGQLATAGITTKGDTGGAVVVNTLASSLAVNEAISTVPTAGAATVGGAVTLEAAGAQTFSLPDPFAGARESGHAASGRLRPGAEAPPRRAGSLP